MLSIKQRLHLIAISIGLFGCYSIFGIFQERIFRREYESVGGGMSEYFTFSVTFVGLQCFFYSLFAKAILMIREYKENETSQAFFGLTSIFYLLGLITSNTALRFISYPSQVIGKALKPIVTMIFGCLVGGKSYPTHKYFFVILIVSGAVMFLFKTDQKTQDEPIFGYSLVGFSLLMNGCMAGVQEKMRSVARPSPLNLMFFLNAWSSLFVIFGIALSGEFFGFIEFCTRHPNILLQISILLVVGSCGQLFTCTMITDYGVVPCCIVLTIRKFFNVMFSVLYFGNVLVLRQWLATALIFTSLLADTILSSKLQRNVDNNKRCEKLREGCDIKEMKTENDSTLVDKRNYENDIIEP